MSVHTYETTYEADDACVNVSIEYEFTPGDPGVLTGPMENAVPPSDPEVEFLAVRVTQPGIGVRPEAVEVWARKFALDNQEDLVQNATDTLQARRDPPDWCVAK